MSTSGGVASNVAPLLVTGAPPANANQAALEVGGGSFAGGGAPAFTGAAAGTGLGVNVTTGADLINAQASGVQKFKVDNGGAITAASITTSGTAGVQLVILGGNVTPGMTFIPSGGATKNAQIFQNGDQLTFSGAGAGDWLKIKTTDGSLVLGGAAGTLGFFAAAGTAKPTITGAKGGNAALASLLAALAAFNLLTDSTTA